jgi:two-component system, sensor histidine kinase and response regulator
MNSIRNEQEFSNGLKNVINILPLAVIITRPDLSIEYVNPAFTRLSGFVLADVRAARAPYPWWPPARHPEYLAELSVVREGKKHKSDWLFNAKDGHEFWIKANVTPLVKEGQVQAFIACWTDITDNKKLEADLLSQLKN